MVSVGNGRAELYGIYVFVLGVLPPEMQNLHIKQAGLSDVPHE